ncbi:2-nitropropane dioxygenase protein [Purpureocillium lavendulum]|uniref:2-nitropropane dioxygenase protein n=1 Tax=Purpureocillium lavendulum TaxID=1247861 RepID=A0AB34G1M2_9HYPO|nr:2-nitropropane dioxygenase protein [Purpureocillium lavendulum]
MASPSSSPDYMQSWFPWTQRPVILSAPMYGISNATLAVEVSKSGGLGIVPAGYNFSPGNPQVVALQSELALARKLLGLVDEPAKKMPVGVGFITCHETVSNFKETVMPLLEAHKPVAVWLFAPDPQARPRAHPDIIRRLHSSGIKAIIQVGSVAAAREAIEDGADIIVAQGTDAGGHQFALGAGLMTLVPEVRAMMQREFPSRQVALVAAGGIMNGGGVAAALALGRITGAEAVVQGTKFIVAKESSASESYKRTVLEARDGGAITIKSTVHDDIQGTPIWPGLYDGRAIVGDSYRDHEAGLPMEENIKKYQDAKQAGDVSRAITWCGTGVGLVNEEMSVKDMLEQVRGEAIGIMSSLCMAKVWPVPEVCLRCYELTTHFTLTVGLTRRELARLNADCHYDPPPCSPSTATSESPDPVFTRPPSESRSLNAWTACDSSAHEHDPLTRKLKLDWRQTTKLYFETVHPWFSILRQDELEEAVRLRAECPDVRSEGGNLGAGSSLQDEAYELLVICMHLLTTTEPTHGDDDVTANPLYQSAKQRFAAVSHLSDPSLEWIQSGLLLSLFEFGHGKTKLAYRSLSETATLARLAGIRPGRYSDDLTPGLIDNAESRRALWWGIFILDQCAHLDPALRHLPSLADSPDDDDLLPTTGVVVNGDRLQSFVINLPVSAPVSIALGGFQRAAQAATVLYHAREWESRGRQPGYGVASFVELDGKIRALLDAMLHQCHRWEIFCDALAMCISSLFVLYAPYLPRPSATVPLQGDAATCDESKALAAVGFAVKFVGDLAVNFNAQISQHALRLANLAPPAPFACFLAAEHMHFLDGENLPDSGDRHLEIFDTLKTFGKRWKVAGDLLDLAQRQSRSVEVPDV